MTNKNEKTLRFLQPSSKALVTLYGLIAVIIVIIPEWLAELTFSISKFDSEKQLPWNNDCWQTKPELRLAAMNIKELRALAMSMKIQGYSAEPKEMLSKRIEKSLRINQFTNW